MVRPKSRKTVEEVYAAANPFPQQSLASTQFDENLFYKNAKLKKNGEKGNITSNNNETIVCKKKQKGSIHTEKKDEKTYINEEKSSKIKKIDEVIYTNFDNKHFSSFVEEENEKDEDTDEFIGLIKETVETAVTKVLSEFLDRNFKDIFDKIDTIQTTIHDNKEKLEKMQMDMTNKIVHYGEENSRHFRYLCMKSEYDKMFYQHQNLITTLPIDARFNAINPFHQQLDGPQDSLNKTKNPQTKKKCQPIKSCNLSNSQCQGGGDFHNEEQSKTSMSTNKSSELGIKEVKDLLQQLQNYYEQYPHEKEKQRNKQKDIVFNSRNENGDADGEEDSTDNMSSSSIEVEENLSDAGDG